MENKKTALIVEGGGQRGVFSFGITDTFIKRDYDPFDIYIGVSNGVAVLCWYLIRETDNNLEKMLYAARGDYLDYKNKRPVYLENFFDKLINWEFVESNL